MRASSSRFPPDTTAVTSPGWTRTKAVVIRYEPAGWNVHPLLPQALTGSVAPALCKRCEATLQRVSDAEISCRPVGNLRALRLRQRTDLRASSTPHGGRVPPSRPENRGRSRPRPSTAPVSTSPPTSEATRSRSPALDQPARNGSSIRQVCLQLYVHAIVVAGTGRSRA
jgi:hypothetical protein